MFVARRNVNNLGFGNQLMVILKARGDRPTRIRAKQYETTLKN